MVKKKRKMRVSTIIIICVIVVSLLVGLGFTLYPVYKTARLKLLEKSEIRQFVEYVDSAWASAPTDLPELKDPEEQNPEELDAPVFPELREACEAYNKQLYEAGSLIWTRESQETPQVKLSDYGYESDVFCYLSIPDADIEVPIYLGATSANLNKGGTSVGQTSLPIGGTNTHAVFAGHRSWSGALHFVGIEKLQQGDLIYITNPWEMLTYRVLEVKTITPQDYENIEIQDGRDLLSIFTCAYPNTRRIICTAERVLDPGN